ncbi:MAG: SRPBCC family protein [Salinisphaera sp.]|jgi:uncharacterized membrane protein|nr:SRPBCC family protein [Salinisphaera sp.]
MPAYRPINRRHDSPATLDSQQEQDRQQALTLAASVGSLMVAMRRGGLSGLAFGALSGVLAYRASTGRGLKGAGTDAVRYAEKTLTGHRVGPLELSASVTIKRSPEDLYAHWRDFSHLPDFMSLITDVRVAPDGRSHWTARAPDGQTLEWDAEITADVPSESIAWASLAGADVPHHGEIRFIPGPPGRGTEVALDLNYTVPHGLLSAAPLGFVNALSGEALREDLRHFKQWMESGEIPTGTIQSTPRDGDSI